jgi:hypothetical protein
MLPNKLPRPGSVFERLDRHPKCVDPDRAVIEADRGHGIRLGGVTGITDPDMREGQAARSYLLQAGEYPAIARANWFGEDFPADLSANPYNNKELCCPAPPP